MYCKATAQRGPLQLQVQQIFRSLHRREHGPNQQARNLFLSNVGEQGVVVVVVGAIMAAVLQEDQVGVEEHEPGQCSKLQISLQQ